jgi:hypothetical protein
MQNHKGDELGITLKKAIWWKWVTWRLKFEYKYVHNHNGSMLNIQQRTLFASILTSLRINAGVVTPSSVFFLTCRGEKFIPYYTIICRLKYFLNITCMVLICENSLTWGGGYQCKVQTLFHSGPMLKIDFPRFPQAGGPAPSSRPALSYSYTHTCETFSN